MSSYVIAHDSKSRKERIERNIQRYDLHYDVTLHCFQQIQIFISYSQVEEQQLVTCHLKLVSLTCIFFLLNNCFRERAIYVVKEMKFIPLNHLSRRICRFELTENLEGLIRKHQLNAEQYD